MKDPVASPIYFTTTVKPPVMPLRTATSRAAGGLSAVGPAGITWD
jgi:hypothetical protein